MQNPLEYKTLLHSHGDGKIWGKKPWEKSTETYLDKPSNLSARISTVSFFKKKLK